MPVNKQVLTADQVRQAAYGLMNQEQLEYFQQELEIDFAISEPGLGRFRVNVFHQRGNPAMVLRYITADMPTLEDLGLPPIMKDLVMIKRGLVLMVGATGSGKSTTLAAMINYRNEKLVGPHPHDRGPDRVPAPEQEVDRQPARGRARHQVVPPRAAQRDARGAGRDPDRRDPRPRDDGVRASTFAGTGHLCLATLHANNAAETLDRIINMFPRDQHSQIFLDLSQYLKAILSQRLVMGKDGARCAAVEVLLNTPHVQELIKKGDVIGVKEALIRSAREGHAELRPRALRALQAGQDHDRGGDLPTPTRAPTSRPRSTSVESSAGSQPSRAADPVPCPRLGKADTRPGQGTGSAACDSAPGRPQSTPTITATQGSPPSIPLARRKQRW